MGQTMLFFENRRPANAVAVGARPEAAPGVSDAYELELREAYERGRRDERARRPQAPVMHTLIAAAAVVGLGASALAWREGSFARAGQIMDQDLMRARIEAQPLARIAALQTGRLAQLTGRVMQRQGRVVERTGATLQARNAGPQPS